MMRAINQNTDVRNGDIFMASLPDDTEGSLQSGTRPVVIVSNDMANKHSPVLTILPITSRMSKKKLPTHVPVEECGLEKKSLVLAEQIMSINRKDLLKKMGSIANTIYERRVKRAMEIQLSL